MTGFCFGEWRVGFECWPFPPKKSDRPEVLVLRRGAVVSVDDIGDDGTGRRQGREGRAEEREYVKSDGR